jgi:hypothetical protein
MADLQPTLGMVRELALAELGEASAPEAFDRQRCARRGLIDWRGRLTSSGAVVLRRAMAKFKLFEARHGR